jgi:c-di-GMP-binding flagellar brake protein YcgR
MNDRRRYERVPFLTRAELFVMPDGPAFAADVTDLSVGGLGVLSPRAVEQGARVKVEVAIPDGGGTEAIVAKVVHQRITVEGNFLGIEFMELLSKSYNPLLWEALEGCLAQPTRVED